MAWIYNKSTQVLTECLNKDVIKVCKADVDKFIVGDSKDKVEKLVKVEEETSNDAQLDKPLSKMKVEELRALAEERGIEGADSFTKSELLEVLK